MHNWKEKSLQVEINHFNSHLSHWKIFLLFQTGEGGMETRKFNIRSWNNSLLKAWSVPDTEDTQMSKHTVQPPRADSTLKEQWAEKHM